MIFIECSLCEGFSSLVIPERFFFHHIFMELALYSKTRNYLYTNARARILEEIEEIEETPYQKPQAKTRSKNTLASGSGDPVH